MSNAIAINAPENLVNADFFGIVKEAHALVVVSENANLFFDDGFFSFDGSWVVGGSIQLTNLTKHELDKVEQYIVGFNINEAGYTVLSGD
jgi:hypothetical protein